MYKVDDYIRFVNIKNINTFLFLVQFIEMTSSKTINDLMKEYLDNEFKYGSVLNYVKLYISQKKVAEKFVNVKSFQYLCVKAKL